MNPDLKFTTVTKYNSSVGWSLRLKMLQKCTPLRFSKMVYKNWQYRKIYKEFEKGAPFVL